MFSKCKEELVRLDTQDYLQHCDFNAERWQVQGRY